jgi:heme O synthase-like polyprenyltransferase
VGPDRKTHIRNVAILLALALAVWLLPGGDAGSQTVYNVLTVILTAGLLFFAYRLYMENRATIFGLGDRQRALLYGSVALAAFAIIATGRLWNEGGGGVFIWLGLIGLAVWGLSRVWRAYREY